MNRSVGVGAAVLESLPNVTRRKRFVRWDVIASVRHLNTRKQTTAAATSVTKVALIGVSLAGSAGLMALALRSADSRWLGAITLLPLLLSVRLLSPIGAAGAGAFWGACLALFLPAADGLSGATVALQALVVAAYAGLGSAVTRRAGFSPLLLGVGWIGVELLLAPLTGRIGLLAATQGADGLFVRTIGQVAGWLLVAFLLAYINASLLEMLTAVCAVVGGSNRELRNGAAAVCACIPQWVLPHPVAIAGPCGPRAPPARR